MEMEAILDLYMQALNMTRNSLSKSSSFSG
jgi:hypothetical protein